MAAKWSLASVSVSAAAKFYNSRIYFQLLHDLALDNSQRFIVTIWSIWKHRNLKLWDNTSEIVAQVVDRAVRMLEDWKLANNFSSNARVVHDNNNINDLQISFGLGHNYHDAPAL